LSTCTVFLVVGLHLPRVVKSMTLSGSDHHLEITVHCDSFNSAGVPPDGREEGLIDSSTLTVAVRSHDLIVGPCCKNGDAFYILVVNPLLKQ